ncbi:MAG: hypothetical protein HQ538_03795 [Parcubacteria group bacterium]|nr:hypothetical protein [Parcubacteria group bacterium]
MIFYEKPIFILDTSFDLGSQLVEDNIAVKLHKDFEPEFILNQINNYTSKKADAWPISPNIEESFEKVFKIEV